MNLNPTPVLAAEPFLIVPRPPSQPHLPSLPAQSFTAASGTCWFDFQTHQTWFLLRLFRRTARNSLFLNVRTSGFFLSSKSQCEGHLSPAVQDTWVTLGTSPGLGSVENNHLVLYVCLGFTCLLFGISVAGGRACCILLCCPSELRMGPDTEML